MPLGWERLNAKTSSPNKNIVFIKPRPGATEATAKDYLERIAASCLPIMNKHHLAVVSLEEYEPNTEFWGRNFNSGEVIQLVLRSPRSGHWLPLRFVQMVMMHELAHIHQMNHSKAFWALRNEYSADMKILWDRGYTGEGLWGRGVLLENGAFPQETLDEGEVLPEHLCGGTFKTRGVKKRKMKPKVTYKEREERRIKKKFGANGTSLGADDKIKASLEKGKKAAGKPRVAQSLRGRELRAAAALARFETAKKEEKPQIKDEEMVTDDETESGSESELFVKVEDDDAFDITGERLVDRKGNSMVRICKEEDEANPEAQRELQELRGISALASRVQTQKTETRASESRARSPVNSPTRLPQLPNAVPKPVRILEAALEPVKHADVGSQVAPAHSKAPLKSAQPIPIPLQTQYVKHERDGRDPEQQSPSSRIHEDSIYTTSAASSGQSSSCPVCSVYNEPQALTCCVCANVLRPDFVAGCWKCHSQICRKGIYVNAGDVNICGVCGTRKRPLVSELEQP